MDTELPRFETCLELYRAAYEQHGTSPFRAAEVSWTHDDAETDHVCRLAVAYGLLSAADQQYRLSCPPDASPERWQEVFAQRAETVRRALTTRRHNGTQSDGERDMITHKGNDYVTVRVTPSDDFDAVATAVTEATTDDRAGVVLRGPGEHANEIQRFADQLSGSTGGSATVPSPEVQKVDSDVEGTDKDELEFRLFLQST